MRKSQKREYELDRKYDLAEWWTPVGKRVTKRRARRRFRNKFCRFDSNSVLAIYDIEKERGALED